MYRHSIIEIREYFESLIDLWVESDFHTFGVKIPVPRMIGSTDMCRRIQLYCERRGIHNTLLHARSFNSEEIDYRRFVKHNYEYSHASPHGALSGFRGTGFASHRNPRQVVIGDNINNFDDIEKAFPWGSLVLGVYARTQKRNKG